MKPLTLARLPLAAIPAFALALACTQTRATAQTPVKSIWNGSTGDWTDASRWIPSTSYPNNAASTAYIAWLGGGTATLDVPITINQLVMRDGTISGSGDLTLLSGADIGAGWNSSAGGYLYGSGTVNLHGASRLYTVGGYPYLYLDGGRTVRNHGTFAWQGGSIHLDSGGLPGSDRFVNETTGILTAGQGASVIDTLQGDPNAAFQNLGHFIKESATTNSPTTIWVAADNSGTAEVRGGSLNFAGAVSQRSDSTLTGGTWIVGTGAAGDSATLLVGTTNITTLGAGADVTLRGAGSTFAQIDTLTDNQGAFRLLDGRDFTVSGSPHFTNGGTLELGSGSVFTVAGGLTNTINGQILGNGTVVGSVASQGLLSPGASPGALSITGALTFAPGSRTLLEIGGPTPGADYDEISVGGLLTFGGTLDVVWYGAFRPGAGDSFDLFDWGSSDGEFAALNLPTLDGGLWWDTSALYADGVLAVIPEPASCAALAGAIAFGIVLMRRRHGEKDGMATRGSESTKKPACH
jgi:hypothetical protein